MYREVSLLEYLPEYLREYKELKVLAETEKPELEVLFDVLEKIRENQFIETCDEMGVARFEKLLGISSNKNDSLETRRSKVGIRWLEDIPYTYETLKVQLDNLCGEDVYEMTLDNGIYFLDVAVKLQNKELYEEVLGLLKRVVPCNLTIDAYIDYNTYGFFLPFMCKELYQYSYDDMREKLIVKDELFKKNRIYVGKTHSELSEDMNKVLRRKGEWFNE